MSAPALTHGGESSDGAWRFGRIWKNKNATLMMIFLPIENVGRKIKISMSEIVKGGPFGLFENPVCCKISEK